MSTQWSLGIEDVAVIIISIVMTTAIGLYYRFSGGRQKTVEEYLLADKKGSVVSVSLSIMATFLSSILIGIPAESYSFGTQFFICALAKIIFVSPVCAYLVYPVFFKMQLISPFEYMEKRFSYMTRCIASLISCMISLITSGISLFLPSLALESLTGMSQEQSVILMSILCTFYASIGGIKAVIITDVFQAVLMYISLCGIIIFGVTENGFFEIWEIAERNKRIEFLNFDLDPTVRHTFWNLLFGGGISYMTSLVVFEPFVQRFMTFRNMKQIVQSTYVSSFLTFIIINMALFAGVVIFAEYSNCDPVMSGKIKKYDELVPYYVYQKLSHIPGATGLFVSGVIAASLSTVSSSLNSLAAMVIEDYIKPFYFLVFKKDCTASEVIIYAKILSVISGIISVVIAFLVRNTSSILQVVITFQNTVASPILGGFLLGMFVPFANEKGALSGMLISVVMIMWASLGGPRPPLHRLPMSAEACDVSLNVTTLFTPNTTRILQAEEGNYFYLYTLSYMWYSAIGVISTVLIGLLVSLFTFSPKKSTNLDPDLFSPPVAAYLRRKNNNCKIANKEVMGKLNVGDASNQQFSMS